MSEQVRAIWSLFVSEGRTAVNRWRFADKGSRRFRRALLLIAAAVMLLIYVASFRIFDHLLYHLELAPELGLPLTTRLIEMIHLLFFVMLFISSLSVSLSVLFIDQEVAFLGTTPLCHAFLMAERTIMVIIRSSWFVVFAASAILLAYARVASPDSWVTEFVRCMALHIVFLTTPCALGMAGTLLLVRYVPARRAKSALVILSMVSLCAIIVAFRMMAPERFLNPRIAPDFSLVLAMVAEPAAPWLPSGWIASGIIHGSQREILYVVFLAIGGLLLSQVAAFYLHQRGLARYLNERESEAGTTVRRAVGRLVRMLPVSVRHVCAKDILVFWRDPTQWSQLIVLLALVVLYAFNFSQFRGQIDRMVLRDMISFINLAMAGFILSAVANRFVFSALSLEGRAFWLVRSSPFEMRKVLKAKAITAFVPLLLLTEAITFFANQALEVSPAFKIVSALVVLLMTISVTSMGIGLGALAPRFDLKDPAQIGMSQHGIFFMGLAMAYVLLFVVVLAGQVAVVWRFKYYLIEAPFALMGIGMLFATAINAAAVILPWHAGNRAIEQLEI